MNQLNRHFSLGLHRFPYNLKLSSLTFFVPSLPASLNPYIKPSLPLPHLSMATFGRKKGVWVAVYVERPRAKRRLLSNSHQPQYHHHHHHQHLHLHQAKNACNNRGYNRKAQLLEYTRQLRESTRSQASSPLLHPKPVNYDHNNHRQPMTQRIAVQKKRRHAVSTPAFMGNWRLLIPGFLKMKNRKKSTNNRSTATKIKALMKSFQVKRKGGFTSKIFATLRKRH